MHGVALTANLDFETFRKTCLTWADDKTKKKFPNLERHNALFDAMHNCFVLDYLREVLRNEHR